MTTVYRKGGLVDLNEGGSTKDRNSDVTPI